MAKYSIGQKVLYRDYKNEKWKDDNLSKPLTIKKVELMPDCRVHYWFNECLGWMNENDLILYNSVGCRSRCPSCVDKCNLWESE